METGVSVGHIAALWRYPVKSMAGESVPKAALEAQGMAGDRRFAVVSTAAPSGKPLLSSRERAAMLGYTPRLDPLPEVWTPEGTHLPLHSRQLLAHLHMQAAAPAATLHLQSSPDLPLTDVRPLSLLSLATLRGLETELRQAIDPQRFRSNIFLDLADNMPFAEDTLCGSVLQLGDAKHGATLKILERIPRCRMVSLDPQTGAVDPSLLPHLARKHAGRVGIYARVLRPGTVHVGDAVCA